MKRSSLLFFSIVMTLLACRKEPTPELVPLATSSTSDSLPLSLPLVESDTGHFIPFRLGSTWNYTIQRYDTINNTAQYTTDTLYNNCQAKVIIGNYVYYDFGDDYYNSSNKRIRLKNGVYYQYLDARNGDTPIMLEHPTVGATWQDTTIADAYGFYHLTHTYEVIADSQQLVTPAGTFNNVVVVREQSRGYLNATNKIYYYKKDIGLLKLEVEAIHYQHRVIQELNNYMIQ